MANSTPPYIVDCSTAGCVLKYAGRDEAASPATGLHHLHEMEEQALLDEALGKKQEAKKEPAPVPAKSSAVA